MTRSLTNELFTPYKEPEREFRSSRRHFKTLSLDELRSPDFNLLFDQEYSEEEVAETMAETMEQYMSKTRADYGSGVTRPKIEDKDNFELKGQFPKELRTNTFSGSDHEDVNEHIEKVLEIVDLFHIPNITIDQVMLRAFPMSLTGAASSWLRNELTSSITTWDGLKTKILNKYCPPARTVKKMEEINNFQQELDENLYQVCERFKELLMKCPQHYLTEMQEVILFYNGLGIPTRQILDSRGAIPSKTAADAKSSNFGILSKEQCESFIPRMKAIYGRYLSTFMSESAKRHEENSNLIKEIRASTDAAIRNLYRLMKKLKALTIIMDS
ncbi:retrovirus-related pol polyprotein from transposon TNT 1-94 [Tanacetum coccineum]|uniref:Retrovirus-related pol polyprotein from transposon TNT 1-94 n=1 Tax=Tanacetum coccineum TaxID=301880 RepID=A0ABQ5G509_9ASTR